MLRIRKGPTEAPYQTELEWDNASIEIHPGEFIDAFLEDLIGFVRDNAPYLLGAVAFCIFLYCIKPQIPDARFRRRGRGLQNDTKPEEDPALRQERIAEALRTMVVIGEDPNENLVLGERDEALELGTKSDAATEDAINNHKEASECIICLEPFGLWDEVAWSSSQNGCKHVWHAECIRPWLQNTSHNDCPSCRTVILPEQQAKNKTDSDSAEGSADDGDDNATSSNISHFEVILCAVCHSQGTKQHWNCQSRLNDLQKESQQHTFWLKVSCTALFKDNPQRNDTRHQAPVTTSTYLIRFQDFLLPLISVWEQTQLQSVISYSKKDELLSPQRLSDYPCSLRPSQNNGKLSLQWMAS